MNDETKPAAGPCSMCGGTGDRLETLAGAPVPPPDPTGFDHESMHAGEPVDGKTLRERCDHAGHHWMPGRLLSDSRGCEEYAEEWCSHCGARLSEVESYSDEAPKKTKRRTRSAR